MSLPEIKQGIFHLLGEFVNHYMPEPLKKGLFDIEKNQDFQVNFKQF